MSRNTVGARGYVNAREAIETRRAVQRLAGRTCTVALRVGAYTLQVGVEVIDSRMAYGREDVLVRPIGGAGKAWMSADSVRMGAPIEDA
jgi:hypothetical protein